MGVQRADMGVYVCVDFHCYPTSVWKAKKDEKGEYDSVWGSGGKKQADSERGKEKGKDSNTKR